MKKFILLILLPVIISGCTLIPKKTSPQVNEKNSNVVVGSQNNAVSDINAAEIVKRGLKERSITCSTVEKKESFEIRDCGGYKFIQNWGQILWDADVNTYQIIDKYYSKDKSNVFIITDKIIGADPQSFQVLKYQFAKDKNNVYYIDDIAEGVDPVSYELLLDGDSSYSKDKNHIYSGNLNIMNDADVSTFQALAYNYAKDKNHAYYERYIIDGADSNTFQALDNNYAKDSRNIYSTIGRGQIGPLDKVDVSSFRPLEEGFGVDKNHVYYLGYLIENADVLTFQFIGREFRPYAKDKDHVYYQQTVVENADPKTFVVPKD